MTFLPNKTSTLKQITFDADDPHHSDLNSFKPYLVPIINQELKSAFKDVEGLGLADLILENDDINFVNSAKSNDQVRNFKFSNFAFIAITIFLILLTIFGTLYS